MIATTQLDTYSPYQQMFAQWVKIEVGTRPQVESPWEGTVLPDEPEQRDAMLHPYHEAQPGQMWIDYFPQMNNMTTLPDDSFSAVYFIDAVRMLHYHTASSSFDWLWQVRYNNGHLYMLVDVPEQYLTHLENHNMQYMDLCAQSLATNLCLTRAFCQYRKSVPDSYLLWRNGVNNWQAWLTHPVCPDVHQYMADLARRNMVTPEQKALRAEEQRIRRANARAAMEEAMRADRELHAARVRELLKTCHSLLELKDALKIRTTARLTEWGVKEDVEQRYAMDRMTLPELSLIPEETFRELCSHYPNHNDLRRCHPNIFVHLRKINLLEQLYPDSLIDFKPQVHNTRKFGRKVVGRKRQYTMQDIWDACDVCTTMGEFRVTYPLVYAFAKRQLKLDEVRDRIHAAHPDTYEAHRQKVYAEFKKFQSPQEFYQFADPKYVAFLRQDDNARNAMRNYYYKRKKLKE